MSVETFPVATPASPPTEAKQETKAPLVGSPEARERQQRAEDIVRRHSLWALGTGAIVIPMLDSAVAAAVQLKMLKSLSDLYGVKFSEDLAKKVVSSLVMGVGAVLGALSAPLMASAFAHALGRVYLIHLESGGTLLDFDPKAMQERFQDEFEKSKQQAAQWLKKEKPEHATTAD